MKNETFISKRQTSDVGAVTNLYGLGGESWDSIADWSCGCRRDTCAATLPCAGSCARPTCDSDKTLSRIRCIWTAFPSSECSWKGEDMRKKLILLSKPQVSCVCNTTSCPREWKKTFIDGLKWFSISCELSVADFLCFFASAIVSKGGWFEAKADSGGKKKFCSTCSFAKSEATEINWLVVHCWLQNFESNKLTIMGSNLDENNSSVRHLFLKKKHSFS